MPAARSFRQGMTLRPQLYATDLHAFKSARRSVAGSPVPYSGAMPLHLGLSTGRQRRTGVLLEGEDADLARRQRRAPGRPCRSRAAECGGPATLAVSIPVPHAPGRSPPTLDSRPRSKRTAGAEPAHATGGLLNAAFPSRRARVTHARRVRRWHSHRCGGRRAQRCGCPASSSGAGRSHRHRERARISARIHIRA